MSRPVRIFLWIVAYVVVGLAITVTIVINRFRPEARNYVISALKQRYKSDVQLGSLQISMFPVVRATGENLVLRVPGRSDLPPMIVIRRFTIEARLRGFFRNPKRVRKVTLEGLQIHLPPKGTGPGVGSPNSTKTSGSKQSTVYPFVLEEVVADGTQLETLPADPTKDPLKFNIVQLTLHTVGPGLPMTFHAELNNAKPPGFIHSDGRFGPWNQDEPADTAVAGHYTFSNANLAVFHGISGTLASSGDYHGELDRIDVHGTTDVPDFALTLANRPIHLRTEFDATVDGTNGDTELHPVHALLGNAAFDISGSIERNAFQKHKAIDLRALAKKTGIDDFLRLTIKSPKPPMKGKIGFDTKVRIPPGETPVIERMQLDGAFTLAGVHFNTESVQEKIASLSHHAQGELKDTDANDVFAQFAGRFTLRNAVLDLPRLTFEVPGAHVDLNGRYALSSGDIDFRGTAKLDATVSQMTTGLKHILLKPVDPLFKRDGAGTVLPIRISGTTGSPSFKLDIGRVLKRQNEE
ncbi:MAG TPA: hypothetical protein VGL82_22900 [Bryobacteraceae bacterium]